MKTRTSRAGSKVRASSRAGFTLLELIIVLVILGLATAVVAPMVDLTGGRVSLRSATMNLASMLRIARGEAVARAESRVLLVDVESGRFYIQNGEARGEFPSESVVTVEAAESEITASGEAGIRFFPDGSATGGTITLESGALIFDVHVDWLTGRVSIEELSAAS